IAQNVFLSNSTYENSAVYEAIQAWWWPIYDNTPKSAQGNVQDSKFDAGAWVTLAEDETKLLGNWANMARAKTTKVGCGAAKCKNDAGQDATYVVCLYTPSDAPTGPVYQMGNNCQAQGEEACPTHPNSQCTESGLCRIYVPESK
ncbi:hypothetical protein AAVH_34128, partial [Aphelenchoides avenae]